MVMNADMIICPNWFATRKVLVPTLGGVRLTHVCFLACSVFDSLKVVINKCCLSKPRKMKLVQIRAVVFKKHVKSAEL